MTIGNVVRASVGDKSDVVAWFIGASLIPVFFVVAGIALRRGEGWILGSLAAFIMVLDYALYGPQPTSISTLTTVIVRAALLILIINGVRGVLVLQKGEKSA